MEEYWSRNTRPVWIEDVSCSSELMQHKECCKQILDDSQHKIPHHVPTNQPISQPEHQISHRSVMWCKEERSGLLRGPCLRLCM
jgi:hypothetical protein